MFQNGRELLLDLSKRFSARGDGRSAAIGRTLAEHADDVAGYAPVDIVQAYSALAKAYDADPPTDPAWIARAATVKEIVADIGWRAALDSPHACAVWDDLIRGVERRRDAAPEHERVRYEAMLLTLRFERRLLGDVAGVVQNGRRP